MLIEQLPEVQSLPIADKWRLIDELFQEISCEIEKEPADAQAVALLNDRFNDYLNDPSRAAPLEEVERRLTDWKKKWKS